MNTLRAGDLTLEPQVAAHAEPMFAVLSDPALYEFERAPPASVEWLRARFGKLESRRSGDGEEQWLNWVIRLPGGELIGYVQATVRPGRRAGIAYELASAHWGRGYGTRAVAAMLDELARSYGVCVAEAVFQQHNRRSQRLLERLGFRRATLEEEGARAEPGERLMTKTIQR